MKRLLCAGGSPELFTERYCAIYKAVMTVLILEWDQDMEKARGLLHKYTWRVMPLDPGHSKFKWKNGDKQGLFT